MHRKELLTNALDLLVLCSLAIAQPLFDLLARNAEFLAARSMDALDVAAVVCLLVLACPVFLAGLELIAARAGRKACLGLHRLLLWLLVTMLLLPPMKPLFRIVEDGFIFIAAAAAVAAILSETYIRLRSRGLALGYLAPVVLVLPGLFLYQPPVRAIWRPTKAEPVEYSKVAATAPVIMVVFDEFPLTSLLNERGEINSLRYPNFARLSRKATWYRNASTVAASTLHAIPAILSGQLPDPSQHSRPDARDFPNTLFTLLGGSYRLNVIENNTRLCPQDLCGSAGSETSRVRGLYSLFSDMGILYLYILLPADLTHPLPNITQSWKEFSAQRAKQLFRPDKPEEFDGLTTWADRDRVFARFVESIRPDSTPGLYFLHVLLPHTPWEYLPSGKKYTLPESSVRGLMGINDQGIDTQQWLDDPWAIQQAYKRHLLQVAMVDGLVGNLIGHLERTGLYSDSLIMITADHGCSFRPHSSRRTPTAQNYADVMAIPLFIKAPGQQTGGTDDSNIESVDILPTIADILDIKLNWRIDGRSVLDRSLPEKMKKMVVLENGSVLEAGRDLTDIYASVKEKSEIFGKELGDLFYIGPHKELIGRRVEDLPILKSPVKNLLEGKTYLQNVNLNSRFVPTNVKGVLQEEHPGTMPASQSGIAIAVNGEIAGMTQAYRDREQMRFSLVLSDQYFRQGRNQIQIYLVQKTKSGIQLFETEGSEVPPYRFGDELFFGKDGKASAYQAEGWSRPEQKITWTDGTRAELVLPVSVPRKPVRLRLYARAYLKPGTVDRQKVRIRVNEHPVEDWVITDNNFRVREAVIPPEILNSGRAILSFELPDSAVPHTIGDGPDLRRLGLAVSWLSLAEQ